MTGALSFIGMLLVIAGVESNPGPDKKCVFRYLYLLIEVGTTVLRKVFDHIIGPDFKMYIDKYPSQKAKFQQREFRKILTPVQLQLLENTPSSDNFDVTLLTCLLRNVCGLCPSTDQVWLNPQPTDNRVEAYITKLRQCRNEMAHIRSVFVEETVLKIKWKELCAILQGLASHCEFSNLQEEIEKANSFKIDMPLEETEKFENAIKDWQSETDEVELKVDDQISNISSLSKTVENPKLSKTNLGESRKQHDEEIASLSTTLGNLEESKKQHVDEIATLSSTVGTLEESKKQHDEEIASLSTTLGKLEESKKQHVDEIATLSTIVETLEKYRKRHAIVTMISEKRRLCEGDKADIQKILIDTYQNDICSGLPFFPLLEDETEYTLKMYQMPTMYVVNYHKVVKQQTDKSPDTFKEVKTCSDLFHVKDKDCKNIYLTGDAGVGKTSFCKFLSLLWCKSKLGKKLENVDMQEYIDYLARFEFVFYVNLRDTCSTDVVAIIVNQLFYSENKDNSNRMYDFVEEILGNHDSLVIMDGLDEWTPKSTDKRMYEIPVRPISLKCVYLTTCRPYKIVNVRLSQTDLDHQVQMTGLGELEIESYVSNLINIINIKCNREITQKEFMEAVEEANLLDMLHIPMTTSHLVMLWLDRPLTSMSKSLIYGNIMDMLFKIAYKKGIDTQQPKPSKLKLPERLSDLKHFQDHFSQIEQLCLLSFKLLFEHDTDITSLVFTRGQLASEPYCLSEEETNFFCTIGILSKNKVNRKFGKQKYKLSFLHKSYLEFFAAIYVSTLDTSDVLELFSQCRTLNDVLKYENFLIFYAGLSIDNLLSLMTRIYSLISKDLELTRELSIFPSSHDTYNRKNQLVSLQSLILRCYNEGSFHVENSVPLEDFIFHDKLIDGETRCLRKLIVFNLKNVRLLWSDTGVYYDEFDNITGLKVLNISMHDNRYNREFIKLVKQNESLQSLSIDSSYQELPLPLEEFHGLTSLSLTNLKISPEVLHHIALFLSKNVQLKHKELKFEICTTRQ